MRRLALLCVVSGATWISRVVVAGVFMLGVLATAGTSQVALEREVVVVEHGEDTEGTGQAGFHVQTPRQLRTRTSPLARLLESPVAPRVLDPQRRWVPRPSWQRPRRTEPPDDEDDDERALL
ncbi:MAG: hypothetical protein R6X02_22905 [Enhygromyxa sp.]